MADLVRKTSVGQLIEGGNAPYNIAHVLDDNGIKRLAVDANLSNVSVSGTLRFKPKFASSTTDVALNTSTDSSLFSFTGDGQINFISIQADKKDWEIVLKINGTESYRIKMDDLINKHFLTPGGGDWFQLAMKNNGKHFYDNYIEGADFSTSFEILAKAVSGTTTIKAWLVKFKEKL